MNPVCETNSQCKTENDKPQVQYYKPDVDVFETEDEYILTADLPGSSSEQIDLDFDQGKLSIRAKATPRGSQEERFLLREYGVADFYRSFEVTEAVDIDSTSADYQNGVLTIKLKKLGNSGLKKIKIASSH